MMQFPDLLERRLRTHARFETTPALIKVVCLGPIAYHANTEQRLKIGTAEFPVDTLGTLLPPTRRPPTS